MNNQLVIGIILIVVGIALALLAYAFILNRRDQEANPEPVPQPEAEPAEAEEEVLEPGAVPPWVKPPAAVLQAPPIQPPAAAVHAPPVEPPPVVPAPSVPPPATPSPTPPAPSAPPAAPAAAPQTPPPPPATLAPSRRTLAVATLLRDEVTGKLLVLVGGREYASVEELRASKDLARVEFAAADLVQWLGASAVRERAAERTIKDEAPKRSISMVEQINAILEHKLVQAFGSTRGIRLVEGPGGALRVYFGLQSYALEDIPDAEVKRMMREAVAEWEAMQ